MSYPPNTPAGNHYNSGYVNTNTSNAPTNNNNNNNYTAAPEGHNLYSNYQTTAVQQQALPPTVVGGQRGAAALPPNSQPLAPALGVPLPPPPQLQQPQPQLQQNLPPRAFVVQQPPIPREDVAEMMTAEVSAHHIHIQQQQQQQPLPKPASASSGGTLPPPPMQSIFPEAYKERIERNTLEAMDMGDEDPNGVPYIFLVGSPRYTFRLCVLLAISLFGVIPLLSQLSIVVLLCSAVLVYIMDYLDFRKGTLYFLFGSIFMFSASLFVSNFHSASTKMGPLSLMVNLCLLGIMWAAACVRHFRWVQERTPHIACMAERAVVALTPLLTLPSSFAVCTALVGSRYSPTCFFAFMCWEHYYFYSGPLRSSYLAARMHSSTAAVALAAVAATVVAEEAAAAGVESDEAGGAEKERRLDEVLLSKLRREDLVRESDSGTATSASATTTPATATATTTATTDDALFLRQPILEMPEAVIFTVLLFILPPIVYNTLQSNWTSYPVENMLNNFGFLGTTVAYLCLDPDHTLWFLLPQVEDYNADGRPRRRNKLSRNALVNFSKTLMGCICANCLGGRDNLQNPELAKVQLFFQRQRVLLLTLASFFITHWAVFRLLSSRYAYMFEGLPFPLNLFALMTVVYLTAFLIIKIKLLLERDAAEAARTARRAAVAAASGNRNRINQGNRRTMRQTLLSIGESAPVSDGSANNNNIIKGLSKDRIIVILVALVITVLLCALGRVPPIFYMPAMMSVTSLNLFLLNRENAGPMISFTVFSSLLLTWWMYITFSFIVMDLRVFGEMSVVPTPLVAIGVLWSYVLGCMCFTGSFSENKSAFIILLYLHAGQFAWVEHVLFSQTDAKYPTALVLFTSAVGVAMAQRLYKNQVLGISGAAFVAALYLAKLFSFVLEVTSAYYYQAEQDYWLASTKERRVAQQHQLVQSKPSLNWERQMQEKARRQQLVRGGDGTSPEPTASVVPPLLTRTPLRVFSGVETSSNLLLAEMTLVWYGALAACYVVVMLEMERRKKLEPTHATRLFILFLLAVLLVALCTIRNVQRACYELVTGSFVGVEELPHIAPGTALVTFALLAWPVLRLQQHRYDVARRLQMVAQAAAGLGVVWLLVQPTRGLSGGGSDDDGALDPLMDAMPHKQLGRYLSFGGLLLVLLSRALPMDVLPFIARALYWLATALLVALGFSAMYLYQSSVALIIVMIVNVFLFMLVLDCTHYRQLKGGEGIAVYAGFALCAVSSLILVRPPSTRATADLHAHERQLQEQLQYAGRVQLGALAAVANLFIALLLRFRLSGHHLLPRALPLTRASRQELGTLLNLATIVSAMLLAVAQAAGRRGRPAQPVLNVLLSAVLLLCSDDVRLWPLSDLPHAAKEHARYITPYAGSIVGLYYTFCYNQLRATAGQDLPYLVSHLGLKGAMIAFVVPAQVSLGLFLLKGKKEALPRGGGGSVRQVLATILCALVALFAAQDSSVQWMVYVAVAGQCVRLYSAKFQWNDVLQDGVVVGRKGKQVLV